MLDSLLYQHYTRTLRTFIASEALVFMLVGTKYSSKCLVGDFLTNKCDADIQTSISADHGLRIWSVNCDGTSKTLKIFKV